MKKFSIILIVLLLYSCVNKDKKIEKSRNKNEITIKSNISDLIEGATVVLSKLDGTKLVESKVIKGEFSLLGVASEIPEEYNITITDSIDNKNIIKFWAANKDIFISGKFVNNKIIIDGCELNSIENKYYDESIKKFDTPEINKEINSAEPDKKDAIINKYWNLINQEQIKFIYNNPNNLVSLSQIIIKKNGISNDSLLVFYNQLDTVLQNSKKGKILKAIVSKRLKIGDSIQDFTARDLKGNPVRLYNFKGRVILLDFWTSWCKPCHMQNQKEFSYLFEKYRKKGLTIISYSIDKSSDKKKWIEASKNDNIVWVNISNLKGFNDPIALLYDVRSIPNSFLINRQGVIVKSFSGYEENSNIIEKEIQKLLD